MTAIVLSYTILVACVLLHCYLWKRLVRDVSNTGSAWRIIGAFITAGSCAIIVLALVSGPYGAPIAVLDSLAYTATAWMNAFLILSGIILFSDVCKFIIKISGSRKAVKKKGAKLPGRAKQVIILHAFAVAVVAHL